MPGEFPAHVKRKKKKQQKKKQGLLLEWFCRERDIKVEPLFFPELVGTSLTYGPLCLDRSVVVMTAEHQRVVPAPSIPPPSTPLSGSAPATTSHAKPITCVEAATDVHATKYSWCAVVRSQLLLSFKEAFSLVIRLPDNDDDRTNCAQK